MISDVELADPSIPRPAAAEDVPQSEDTGCVIGLQDFNVAYQSLRDESLDAGPVCIFPACDVDSLCAVSILTELLKADGIQYKIRPVASYEDLAKHADAHIKGHDEVRSVVLINCGATVDLMGTILPAPREDQVIHYYIFDSHRPFNLRNVHETTHFVIFDTTPAPSYPHEEGELSELAEEEDAARLQKRRRLDRPPPAELENYYNSNFYGAPVSHLMYNVADQLDKGTNYFLWLAITGSTSAYLHQHIELGKYEELVQFYHDVVDADLLPGEPKIKYVHEEYHWMLYRHWSLYDSMFHSRSFACRLGIWTEGGRKKLQTFLAKVGLSLNEAHQQWGHLTTETKTSLREKINAMEQKDLFNYGLTDVMYKSFTKVIDSRLTLSAADCVHAIDGLLEKPRTDMAEEEQSWESNFWTAFEALRQRGNTSELMRQGMKQAIELQRDIVAQAATMLERHVIVNTGPFRHTFISESLPKFTHTLALSKLASFLDETQTESRKPQKPFLICALNERKNSYLVVGFVGFGIRGKTKLNAFGNAFRLVASDADAHLKQHAFDHSIVEVAKDDIRKFIEHLLWTMHEKAQ